MKIKINYQFIPALLISLFSVFIVVPKSGLEWVNPVMVVVWLIIIFWPVIYKMLKTK